MPDPTAPRPFPTAAFLLDCRGRILDCRPGQPHGAHVVGILNVTPDSFSDGGEYGTVAAAVARAGEMVAEGAAIIDVGGASSRPQGATYGAGAAPVGTQEEIDRVVPVIEAVARAYPEVLLSVDTYRVAVAEAALAAGVHIINDITGLRHEPALAVVAARHGAPLVVMHAAGSPGTMPHEADYHDVLLEVTASLATSLYVGEQAGVAHIVLDPGFGFGKTVADNLRVMGRVDALMGFGRPVLVGVSRKSSVGVVVGAPGAPAAVPGRLYGTLGVTAVAVLGGATLVRTHDVRPTVEMLRGLAAARFGYRAPDA